MKKRLFVVIGLLLVLGVASCGKKTTGLQETTGTQTEAVTTDKSTENTTEATTEADTEVATSADKGETTIEFYKGNNDASGIIKTSVKLKEVTPENIVEEFIKIGILGEDTKVLGFEVKDKIATLNLSSVPSTGTAGESIMLGAVGNTFARAFHVEKVRLLLDGENYSSGHIEFTDKDYLIFGEGFGKITK